MRLIDEQDAALAADVWLVHDVDAGVRAAVLFCAGIVTSCLLWAAVSLGVPEPTLILAAVPSGLFLLAWKDARRPARLRGNGWRVAIDRSGVYVRLESPVNERPLLHLALDEISAAQRCQRRFTTEIKSGSYLDIVCAPEVLARLPVRPLVTSLKFGALVPTDFRVSWDDCRLRIALPSTLVERDPEVDRALEALHRVRIPVLPLRNEFWPTSFDLKNGVRAAPVD